MESKGVERLTREGKKTEVRFIGGGEEEERAGGFKSTPPPPLPNQQRA